MMTGGCFPGRQYITENQAPQLESGLFNQESELYKYSIFLKVRNCSLMQPDTISYPLPNIHNSSSLF